MAAILLGRKYIDDKAYGGTIALSRITTTTSPDTFVVAPVAYTSQARVVSAKDSAGAVIGLTASSATITFTDGGVNNETVTIAGRVYTLKTTPTTVADEVKVGSIGSSANKAILVAQALADAININPATSGTSFGSATTVNLLFTATVSGAVVTLVGRSMIGSGSAGTLATNVTGATVSAATITGGSANAGVVSAGAPVVVVSGDRTSTSSTVTVTGFPVGAELVILTVHGELAGVNSSVIG